MQNSLINLAFKKAKNENRSALLTYTVAGIIPKKITRNFKVNFSICGYL